MLIATTGLTAAVMVVVHEAGVEVGVVGVVEQVAAPASDAPPSMNTKATNARLTILIFVTLNIFIIKFAYFGLIIA